ncbi:MAG: tRNA (adenosine(37)-N6)-threonylcarbamoyltransferase complex ATPase subunit type 1 TsaE [Bacteriovoracales bacterium]
MFDLVLLKRWDKVLESDLDYISLEIKKTTDSPAAIFLEGPLGAGKTTFTKHFIKSSGGETFSPTYSIINEVGPYVHADFYRLKDPEEIIHLELDYYLQDKDYVIIEWGKEYLSSVIRYLDETYSIYQLEIQIDNNFRNFKLFKINLNR